MSRVQKDRLLSLSLKEKKLIRLLYNKDLNEQDTIFLNRIYEEKQHLHFYYAVVAPSMLSLVSNYCFFRKNSRWFQVLFVVSATAAMHVYMTTRINNRFTNLTQPYFEKYQIN